MGMRIKQLQAALANQIAAGEVIERPASVIKELLENALDAKACRIDIEVDGGGLHRMRVSDDGVGIVAEDLPLAIASHATSKINCIDDLYTITSMGFRGEALASIASVSKLTIVSKPADQVHAMQLEGADKQWRNKPCARSTGTTVEVRDLFFNVPVRKKFLKSEQTEYQAIEALVKRFAMSHGALAITLKHNGKERLSLPIADDECAIKGRIKKLLGRSFLDNAIYVDAAHGELTLQGWVSSPAYQRSQNDKIWIYINQRMVKDKLMLHSIRQAYEPILYPGRSPACLLYLTLNPKEVDVNVHPTKHEVRFQQPRLIHDLVVSHLQRALGAFTSSLPASEPLKVARYPAYEKSPPPYLAPLHVSTGTTWTTVNEAFAILQFEQQSFLVEVTALARHRLRAILQSEPRPLASRRLMTPIRYAIDTSNIGILIEQVQGLLMDLGIELDFIGETTLVIRTIPQCLPQLDIRVFLDKLTKSMPIKADLLWEWLLGCQTFHAAWFSAEEQAVLWQYFEQIKENIEIKPFYKQLDVRICRELLNA